MNKLEVEKGFRLSKEQYATILIEVRDDHHFSMISDETDAMTVGARSCRTLAAAEEFVREGLQKVKPVDPKGRSVMFRLLKEFAQILGMEET